MLYEHEQTTFETLVGHKILALHGDSETLSFVVDGGDVYSYTCEGDCCSQSWFCHISGVDELVGHTVTGVETIPMPEIPKEEQREEDVAYGYQITTDKGRFLVEMRNSSNGYYGGWVNSPQLQDETTSPKILTDF